MCHLCHDAAKTRQSVRVVPLPLLEDAPKRLPDTLRALLLLLSPAGSGGGGVQEGPDYAVDTLVYAIALAGPRLSGLLIGNLRHEFVT